MERRRRYRGLAAISGKCFRPKSMRVSTMARVQLPWTRCPKVIRGWLRRRAARNKTEERRRRRREAVEAFWYTDVHGAIGRSIARFFKARCTPEPPCIEVAFRYFPSKTRGWPSSASIRERSSGHSSHVRFPWSQSQTYGAIRNL